MTHLGSRVVSLLLAAAPGVGLAACADAPTTPAATPAVSPSATVGPPGTLLWFGYADGAYDDETLIGTASYANFGQVITDANPSSTWVTQRVNALSQHNMKAVVELGELLWCGASHLQLCGDVTSRWQTWKAANASVLTSDRVLGFIIRDEPIHGGVNVYHWEAAAALVKQDFPWAKILLFEAAVAVACPPEYYSSCPFDQQAGIIHTVDWIGVDRFAIDPVTDGIFRAAVQKMKQYFPGRKMAYIADGFWTGEHVAQFQGGSILTMEYIMARWYEVARADPDAVLLGVYVWKPFYGGTSSRGFPPSVLAKHTEVGRAITGRTRTTAYQPTGVFEGIGGDGFANGWACDPDGAWGESAQVDFYMNGAYLTTTYADKPDVFRTQCRSGISHRFRMPLSIGTSGQPITAVARDLNAGAVQLPSNCAGNPACVWYYDP